MFNWWCVWVSVCRFFGFVLGLRGFFDVMMQKTYFVFAAALLRNVDPVMLSMQKHEVSCVIKRFPVFFHPAPRFVKEC